MLLGSFAYAGHIARAGHWATSGGLANVHLSYCPSLVCVLQYRTTVGKMLARQANDAQNPAQFIITTFHPQLLHETDKVYGVSHYNRISR